MLPLILPSLFFLSSFLRQPFLAHLSVWQLSPLPSGYRRPCSKLTQKKRERVCLVGYVEKTVNCTNLPDITVFLCINGRGSKTPGYEDNTRLCITVIRPHLVKHRAPGEIRWGHGFHGGQSLTFSSWILHLTLSVWTTLLFYQASLAELCKCDVDKLCRCTVSLGTQTSCFSYLS